MTNKPKRYCTGIDCAWCGEKEPCIYRIANRLEEENVKFKAELEQTLIEIKEIVKNMNEECFYGDFKCEDCDFKNGCTYQAKKQLKQIISEVIKDE